jgi:tetratricopeptide (TPR) repeat protein
MREILIPYYAKSKLGQHFYFESFFDMDSLVLHSGDNIDFYLANKKTVNAFIYGHFLKFMQYFLAEDNVNCLNEYQQMRSTEIDDNTSPVIAGYYFGAQVIYQSVFYDKVDPDLIHRIYKMSEMYYETGVQHKTVNPIFEHIIIYSLNYGNKFKEICKLMDLMLQRFEVVETALTWHNQLSKIIYARALLNTGNVEKAISTYREAELKIVPVNYKNYVKIRFNLAKAEFLIFEKKYIEAKILLEEIKTVGQMIRHKYLYNKALILESKICD